MEQPDVLLLSNGDGASAHMVYIRPMEERTLLELVCVGMSHVQALSEAYLERRQRGDCPFNLHAFILDHPPYDPPAVFENDELVFNKKFDADFKECLDRVKPSVIFAYLIGAEHFNLSFINSPRPFDILMPGQNSDRLAAGAELIPYDLMLTTCEFMAHGLRDWLPHLQELSGLPVYQIGPPPPVTGDEFMRTHSGGALFEQIERYGIAPESLRSKVWQICVSAFERQCAAYRVEMIRPPAEALGETQCLLPQYRGHDQVHANPAYGDLLLDRMLSIAEMHAGGEIG
jgi:hypothetical protein